MMSDRAKRKFAKLVQDLREDLGINQKKMAEILEIAQSTVSTWENAKFNTEPTWQNIQALARLMGTTVDELCVEVGITPQEQYDLGQMKASLRTASLRESLELTEILLRRIKSLCSKGSEFVEFVELAEFAIARVKAISEKPASIGEALRTWMLVKGKSVVEVARDLEEFYGIENALERLTEILGGDLAYEEELAALATTIYEGEIMNHDLSPIFGIKKSRHQSRDIPNNELK